MRFATVVVSGERVSVVSDSSEGWYSLSELLGLSDSPQFEEILARGVDMQLLRERLHDKSRGAKVLVEPGEEQFGAPFLRNRKIWGIGLNYAAHAADLAELRPEQPASFIKGDHTIIGHGDEIVLPQDSQRVTAEAELGIVIGRECYKLDEEEDPFDYVFGFVPILDQTAEDILQLNPRYLTRSKNYPTFFSFGPTILSLDEALDGRDVGEIEVKTVRNGEVVRANTISAMMFGPQDLIRYHARIMPLFPGDIISTGTPGAGHIQHGDVVEAQISGFPTLINSVRQG